jgi:TPR repeat protein
MKKVLFILCFSFVYVGIAQPSKLVKKTPSRKYRASKINDERPDDSAHIYYVRGWDAYNNKDFGAARYYWERGSNCITNIPSRYSCAFRLALMHQNGEGIGVNFETAFYYYNLAYANGQRIGNIDATKNIAAYYENGIVMLQNYYKALEWYQKAKNQGNQYCNDDIARVKRKIAEY